MTSIIVPSSSDATTVLASAITVLVSITIIITVTIVLMAINIIIRKRKSTILQHINDRYHSIIIIHKLLLLLVSVSINVHSNSQSEKGQYYHRDHVTIACMISL